MGLFINESLNKIPSLALLPLGGEGLSGEKGLGVQV